MWAMSLLREDPYISMFSSIWLNPFQPLRVMWPFLVPSGNYLKGFSFLKMLVIVIEKLQNHDILNTDKTYLFYNFLPDKFLTFPMGKNHRKMCEGEIISLLLVFFSYRWKIFLY